MAAGKKCLLHMKTYTVVVHQNLGGYMIELAVHKQLPAGVVENRSTMTPKGEIDISDPD